MPCKATCWQNELTDGVRGNIQHSLECEFARLAPQEETICSTLWYLSLVIACHWGFQFFHV